MSGSSRVWKFGDDVNTDLIIPGKYLDNYDPAHLASHAMEGVSKEFYSTVRPGDVIVAGENFGCGSSREQAVVAIKGCGVGAVLAKSFARIFYRNAINLGLPVLISPDSCALLEDGDKIDFDRGRLELRISGGKSVRIEPVPPHLKRILDEGGLVPYIRIKLEQKEVARLRL